MRKTMAMLLLIVAAAANLYLAQLFISDLCNTWHLIDANLDKYFSCLVLGWLGAALCLYIGYHLTSDFMRKTPATFFLLVAAAASLYFARQVVAGFYLTAWLINSNLDEFCADLVLALLLAAPCFYFGFRLAWQQAYAEIESTLVDDLKSRQSNAKHARGIKIIIGAIAIAVALLMFAVFPSQFIFLGTTIVLGYTFGRTRDWTSKVKRARITENIEILEQLQPFFGRQEMIEKLKTSLQQLPR